MVDRALVHLDVAHPKHGVHAAIRATPEDTEADLRDVAEAQAMTEQALVILGRDKTNAYQKALATLREDTLEWWDQELEGRNSDFDGLYEDEADGEPYQADGPSLRRFLEGEMMPWYARQRLELENRSLIRSQAFGEALDPNRQAGPLRGSSGSKAGAHPGHAFEAPGPEAHDHARRCHLNPFRNISGRDGCAGPLVRILFERHGFGGQRGLDSLHGLGANALHLDLAAVNGA